MNDLRIFIGWDSKEPIAFSVLAHSILTQAKPVVTITPLTRKGLDDIYDRPRTSTEATEFSLTRFLVPSLCNYQGWALFLDCDMLCRGNIYDILHYPQHDPGKSVYVVQHDYIPKSEKKFDGHVQTTYPRKNWSSVMLFNCELCRTLTPEYVNTASGLELHRFNWIPDSQIGSLPTAWNYLVSEYPKNNYARLYHYTNGTPCFEGYEDSLHSDLWHGARDEMERPITAVRA